MIYQICLISLVLGLTACSKQVAQDPRQILTRARIDAPGTPLLLADVEGIETVATLAIVARNKTVETWQTGDRVSLSLDQGLVTATRGLGEDLMSADNSGTRRCWPDSWATRITSSCTVIWTANTRPPFAAFNVVAAESIEKPLRSSNDSTLRSGSTKYVSRQVMRLPIPIGGERTDFCGNRDNGSVRH